MALIECKECGHDVSTAATSCPNFGVPAEIFDPLSSSHKEVETNEHAKRKELGKDKLFRRQLAVIIAVIIGLTILYFSSLILLGS